MRGVLVGLLALAACNGRGEYDVVVGLANRARAATVEVAIVRACAGLDDLRDRPADPLTLVTVKDGPSSDLGPLASGQYGLHARAVDASCVVFAADCDTVVLKGGGSGTLSIFVGGRPERYECGPGHSCDGDGVCAELPDQLTDAGTDAGDLVDAGPDSGFDEDRDGDGVADMEDHCPDHWDPEQVDSDGDGLGDACDDAFGECEEVDDCEGCVACGDSSVCASELALCAQAQECVGFTDCVNNCQFDFACESACRDDNPEGYALYVDYHVCILCLACPNRCANDFGNPAACDDGGGGG